MAPFLQVKSQDLLRLRINILIPFAMSDVSIQDLFQRFLQYGELFRNYSPYPLKEYKTTCEWFFRSSGVNTVSDLNKEVLKDWFFHGRLDRKWSASTFRHRHKHLNMFMKWLIQEGYLKENYVADIEKPRLEQRLPRTLTREQAQLVLDASFHMKTTYRFERYRNHAIVAIMVLAGLRRKEVFNLKMQDASFETRTIFIQQGKGAKDRIVPMNVKLVSILLEYLKERKRLNKQSLYFFTAVAKDEPIARKCNAWIFRRLRQVTKLNFSAHTLRHAFARLMLEGGCDIYTLSKIMGHTKITTTAIYLSCSNQQMSKAVEMHCLN